MGFTDIFEGVKQKENTSAMEGLATLLSKLDGLNDKAKIGVLIDNVLAGGGVAAEILSLSVFIYRLYSVGNMYDWG